MQAFQISQRNTVAMSEDQPIHLYHFRSSLQQQGFNFKAVPAELISALMIFTKTEREHHAETDEQETGIVWTHMQNVQQQKDQAADVRENGGHEQEAKTSQGMAGRHHRMGQGISPQAESSSDGQKALEDFDGVGHLRAPSPRC